MESSISRLDEENDDKEETINPPFEIDLNIDESK
jgi:hypothetical protein